MLDLNKCYNFDCKVGLRKLEDNSVDLIATDPPYAISFMSKTWDKSLVSVEVWRECLRVLKPGAFAFIMSAPRQDVLSRMIVNIEDAGFRTDFTSLYWTYACLSEDTEFLTEYGWERWHRNIEKSILIYDIKTKKYSFEKPEKWYSYDIFDTMYRIKSDTTDQLVTRNHRVVVEREGELLCISAERLQAKETIPAVEIKSDFRIVDFQGVSKQLYSRNREGNETTLATITKEKYKGIVFCPTVSTGCFVARRNGKIFLTGNSGFPKAMNISKSVKKKLGEDSEEAKALDGAYSGFNPKPAIEIILVCMKPLQEKSKEKMNLNFGELLEIKKLLREGYEYDYEN